MKTLKTVIATLVVLILLGVAFIFSGVYNVGADVPHFIITRVILASTRERSVERHSADLKVPNLDDPAKIAEGARHYAHSCAGCHLAPGSGSSEIRQMLDPHPPDLVKHGDSLSPKEIFWVAKHGIKMTAMPAWGKKFNDDQLWSIVAFVRKMPGMSYEQYQKLSGTGGQSSANSDADHDEAQGSGGQSTSSGQSPTPAAGSAAPDGDHNAPAQ